MMASFHHVMIKWGFYLQSMIIFLLIVMVLGTNFPLYIGPNMEFAGVDVLYSKGVVIPVVCTCLLLLSCVFGFWLKNRKKGTRLGPVSISFLENKNSEIMSYVASYFFPLVSFSLATTWRHVVVLTILFVVLGFIYIRSDVYYRNPTMLLLGYRSYHVIGTFSNPGDVDFIIITRDILSQEDKFLYVPIDNHIFLAFKYEKRGTQKEGRIHL